MAKKSKPSGNGCAAKKEKKNKLKNNLSVLNSLAMKNKAPKPNPFESMWSRRKFDILGKKQKGEERRVGLSRSIAIEKRKKTLLMEYEQSGKSSAFVDKRIGEQNEVLGEFDKAILRSQCERQLKMKKKSKYNLSDGEDEFDFQGSGPFPERDDFEDELLFDEDENENGEAAGSASKT
ncbi:nucleolar 14 [Olea europaea subsp. europaea]|uniref:Nucleolar 14 n=1 Tax=Olea europaea subsp. europaea TaxID=158383 RepID=A0A8S0RSU3_OLEEU|nr:nucleolar 14 [Olea europaea subsp. europaea]